MEKYRIEHTAHTADFHRLYDMLCKMDNYMMPPLSQRVCLKEYTQKLVGKAEIFYIICREQDCGHCAIYMNDDSKAYITSFGILPEFQGMGLGNKLIQKVICEAELRKIGQIGLEVHCNNIVARSLYFKAGFRQTMETGETIKMVKYLKQTKHINLLSTSLSVTERCTLRCKLCLSYTPYYIKPKTMKFEMAGRILESYFNLIQSVDKFAITGGEPLTNPDMVPIIEEILRYKEKINKEIILITNGTIMIKKELIELFCKNKDKVKIVLNDYGKALSTKADAIYEELCIAGLENNTAFYHENNRYGWIDCRDHSLKHKTIEERDRQGGECVFHKGMKYIISADGGLYTCTRSYYRMLTGIIPKDKEEYIDLLGNEELTEKRESLINLMSQRSTSSCAYCSGRTDNVPLYPAAEQLVE